MRHGFSRSLLLLTLGVLGAIGFNAVPRAEANPHLMAMMHQMRARQMQMMQQMQQHMQQQMQQQARMMQQQQQQMMRAQQQVMRQMQMMARNASRQMQRMSRNARRNGQRMRNMPRPRLEGSSNEYEFIVADEAAVRTMVMLTQPELDEKGRPKKLDAAEKAKLKGDTPAERKMVGYKANLEDIQVGDVVNVTFSVHRPKRKPVAPKVVAKKDDEKKDEAKKDDEKKDEAKDKAADKEDPKKDKAADKDGMEEEHKGTLADWKPVGRLQGIVVESDASGSRRMVIAIPTQHWVMPGQRNNQQNQNQNKTNHISIDPSQYQATFVIVTGRPDPGKDSGGSGNAGFGTN